MSDRTLQNQARVSDEKLAELARMTADHHRLSDVTRWSATLVPPRRPILTVAQDEFSHDVVIGLEDELHLVYGVT